MGHILVQFSAFVLTYFDSQMCNRRRHAHTHSQTDNRVYMYFRNFRKGGGKCRVVPAVGGHGRCAARSLEGGVEALPQKMLDF